jgi:dephospho-CoA kinase
MLVLGVTGGIGAGKSTVARILESRGARVLDADAIVRDLYQGGELAREIEAALGPGLLRGEGSVDRAALAKRVFDSPEARRRLEEIVHPAVRKRILEELESWRAQGFLGIAVIDAALLVEAKSPYPLDALVLVTAREELRLERLARRGLDREEAQRRMRAQASDREKRKRADFVIANDADESALEREVSRLLGKLGRDRVAPAE